MAGINDLNRKYGVPEREPERKAEDLQNPFSDRSSRAHRPADQPAPEADEKPAMERPEQRPPTFESPEAEARPRRSRNRRVPKQGLGPESGFFTNEGEEPEHTGQRRVRIREHTGRRGTGLHMPDFAYLARLWWLDAVCIVLTVLGLAWIIWNLDSVVLAIAQTIVNLASVMGMVALLFAVIAGIWLFSGRRWRR